MGFWKKAWNKTKNYVVKLPGRIAHNQVGSFKIAKGPSYGGGFIGGAFKVGAVLALGTVSLVYTVGTTPGSPSITQIYNGTVRSVQCNYAIQGKVTPLSKMCQIPACSDALGDECKSQQVKFQLSVNSLPPVSDKLPVSVPDNSPVLPSPTAQPPTVTPTASSTARCDIFKNIPMSFVLFPQSCGGSMTFYVKMPGGVPGLTYDVLGDDGNWEYKVKIGHSEIRNCGLESGYGERLYCTFPVPVEYYKSIQPVEVHVNGCSEPVFVSAVSMPENPCLVEAPPQQPSNQGGSGQQPLSGISCSSVADCDWMGDYTCHQGVCMPRGSVP